ncbi:MAG: ABC transporter ATP-binding protein/permease, partial [Lachnospiraceae bacterium]
EFADNRKMVAGMVLTQWVMLLANVLLMLVTADFIAGIFEGKGERGRILWLAAALLLTLILRGGMSYLNARLSYETSRQLKKRLRTLIYEKLMRLGSGYRENANTSEVVQISTEGVEQLEIYFGKYVPQFFYSMLAPVTLFLIVGTMSLKVAVVLLLCVPLIPVSIVAVQKFAKKMLAKYWGTYTELGDSFLECLQGLTTLKIYQADARYAKKMDEESEKFRKVTMRVLIMQLNSISIMDLVAYGGAGIGIILSILELRSGAISLSQCFFMIMISAEFFLPLRLLGSFFHIAMNGNAAADKIFRLLDEKEPEAGKIIDRAELKKSSLRFEQVDFSYDGEKQVLRDISLRAGKGLTALVGESGCGKSTIISLVMKEAIPQKGDIQIGEQALSDIDTDALYRKVTRVGHDSYLFAGTVESNLLMGKQAATKEEMYEALKKVQLYDFVMENGGLSMELSEKAANLSGGQKQRLALARALLHDTDIYIFDEAASNVDVESENAIMAVVRELAKTKTVILVSHRLANVVEADRIYVMQEGRMTESGSHEELYEKKGHYHRLFTEQMRLEQYGREERKHA